MCAGKTGRFHCAIEIISFLGGNPKNFRPHGNHAEPVGYHTRQVVILGRVSGSAQAFSMGGRGVRDPVPDIREIIIDRKEDGGLPSSTFLNLAPEK